MGQYAKSLEYALEACYIVSFFVALFLLRPVVASCGLVIPAINRRVAEFLGLDYAPSAFQVILPTEEVFVEDNYLPRGGLGVIIEW